MSPGEEAQSAAAKPAAPPFAAATPCPTASCTMGKCHKPYHTRSWLHEFRVINYGPFAKYSSSTCDSPWCKDTPRNSSPSRTGAPTSCTIEQWITKWFWKVILIKKIQQIEINHKTTITLCGALGTTWHCLELESTSPLAAVKAPGQLGNSVRRAWICKRQENISAFKL